MGLCRFSLLFGFILLATFQLNAKLIPVNPSNYNAFLNSLMPGDTLLLLSGVYNNNLKLVGLNGTSSQAIVIMGSGNASVLQAQSCCNTISITQCSYLIIQNLNVDGLHQQVDAVKAEGTSGNWAHHITLQYLNISNYDGDQQNVGISTKCPAWNWVIRKNKLHNIGTGMYLGNSDGSRPFVNGIIEYNYIANTIGYNIEIKHQLNGVRDEFPGIAVNGKTIIRHNVFTKNQSSSTGGNARPNLLVGGFPTLGWGSNDYYEIYGNFFYNNPVEALFQGTGNIMLYENIFVNHYDPPGFRAVYITPQNGISPQDVKVYHNTIWAANSSGGLRLYNPNTNYKQYCYANAVFSPAPITNFSDQADNITDHYNNAGLYVLAADPMISSLDLYPKNNQLKGSTTASTLFQTNTTWDKDFNGDQYDWSYRGAYSGCCINKGWPLQLDTISDYGLTYAKNVPSYDLEFEVYPNPVSNVLHIDHIKNQAVHVNLYNVSGNKTESYLIDINHFSIDFTPKVKGIYILEFSCDGSYTYKKIIKQ